MSYDNYLYGKVDKVCGCRPSVSTCADFVWDIYDDDCCDLVKIAYNFFSEKSNCIVQRAQRILNELVCGCISRREFEIRYGLFTLTIQKINRIVICALRRILQNDRFDGKKGDFLGYDFGCFENDYCQTAVASVVCTALTYVEEAADIKSRLNLGREVEQCTLRLLIERLEDALSLLIQDCNACGKECSPCGKKFKDAPCKKGYGKGYYKDEIY